ncbi:hypothetical protein [Streptomyces sp. NPDC048282]|uniref:hypothetical protein n=1 Tax=Streptomyces sp. NPDC048282 TaxID=3365528 RepID=UPI00371CC9BD
MVIDHCCRNGEAPVSNRRAEELPAARVEALMGELSEQRTILLLALWPPVGEPIGRQTRKTFREGRRHRSRARGGTELGQVTRSFHDAEQVTDAIEPDSRDPPVPYLVRHWLPELRYSLRDNVRVQRFVRLQLGHLIQHDERHRRDLVVPGGRLLGELSGL